jgi:hypothetical protein
MFLKIHHDDDASLVEVLDPKQLVDPFAASIRAQIHGGEELQDPQMFLKRISFSLREKHCHAARLILIISTK